MHTYIEWKKSTIQATSVPHYIRWVKKFHDYTKKYKGFTLEDTSQFKLFCSEHYNPKNVQYGMSIIRDYINYLISIEKLDFPIHLFRVKQERSNSHYAVTELEYRAMLGVLQRNNPMSLQRKLMLMLLHDTGMRGGELLRLKLSDLKPRQAVIHNEKNKRSRLIGWTQETEDLLQFYLPLRENMSTKEDWVFVSFKWKPTRVLTTRQLERIVFEVKNKAGIEAAVRPHSFRHGFVHRKLDEGKPVTTVSQMLGHSTAMNVINYAQLSGREIKDAWGI